MRYVIIPGVITTTALFTPRGMVSQWTQGIARSVEIAAIDHAPPNRSHARWGTWATGALASQMYRHVATTGTHEVTAEVGNRSEHALYVHEGTATNGTGHIYTNLGWANQARVDKAVVDGTYLGRGYYMPVEGTFRLRVRGQRANPFLTDGWNLVARNHAALHRL